MLKPIFSGHVLGVIVHFRFYLKYFAYFQLKDNQDGGKCMLFSQETSDLRHCLCIKTERFEHNFSNVHYFLLELILEWEKKFGLPEISVVLSKYGHKQIGGGGGFFVE